MTERPRAPRVEEPTGGPLRQGDAELARLASLHALDVLATPAEERFDRIVALARLIFQVPMAAIALIDADRQWIKAAAGLDSGDSVPRRYSPCHYTVQQRGALVLEDTAHEARVADTTVVSRGVRFYAGQPLHAPTGERVGSLCVMDTVPRTFTAEQQQVLAQLGRLVEQELAATGELAVAGAAQRALLSPADVDVPGYELAGRCTPARRAAGSYFDWSHEGGRVQLQVADVLGGDASGGDVAGAGVPGAGLSGAAGPGTDGAAAPIEAVLRTLLRATDSVRVRRRPVGRSAVASGDLAGTFVTAFAATLDPATGDLAYVLAGYGAAIVLGPAGARRLAGSGPALGLSAAYGTGWDVRTARLARGDTLLVLTDGFLDLHADPDAALARGLGGVAQRYPGGIGADEAVDLATAWAVTEGHPIDITVLAVHRGSGRPRRARAEAP